MWPRSPPHSLTTFELVPDLLLGRILVFLFYFIFPFLIVCRSHVAHLHFFSILQFYFHRTVVRRASRCHLLRFHDPFLRSIRQFAHTYLMLLCSQRHFDQMRHMSLPARCYPFNPAIVNPANTSYSISCSRTHIQPFDVSLSQPVQPSVPVYKVTSFSCFRSPSQHLAGPFYAPFSTYVCSHQLA